MLKKLNSVNDIYQYLDNLFDENVDGDTLFASGYLRGFIALAAIHIGDEQEDISATFIEDISLKLANAKAELSPQDNVIVQNFWYTLQEAM